MPTNPLLDVQTWLYHLGDVAPADMDEVAAGAFDLVVLEYARYPDEEIPYTPEQLAAMRGADDTLIVSYLSIGEAESYRFYWDTPEFQAIRDTVVDAENPEWEENFKVRYWLDEWQGVIFDYIDRIIDGGFNGLYLDIIDGYEYWEEKDPGGSIDYRQEMADFVAAIRAHAEARLAEMDDDRTFVIIGQNGEELLQNQTYLDAIDGVGKEDLQFYYDFTTPEDFEVVDEEAVSYSLDLLQLAIDAGKQVVAVEYLDANQQGAHSGTLAALADTLWSQGIPLYVSENRLLDTIFTQPNSSLYVRLSEGSGGADFLRGGIYGDTIVAKGGDDQIFAGPGDRSADVFIGGAGNDIIGGGAGDDLLIGGGASDGSNRQLLSGSGNTNNDGADVLYGGTGSDTLIGGSWNDALIDDNGRFDRGEAITSGSGADRLWAGQGDDLVYGAAGADGLGGGQGNDVLFAGGGNDTLYGGRGDGAAIGLNDVLSGEDGDDEIFASGGDDSVSGGAGDDLLYGGGGGDTLLGGTGADTLWGGAGNDQITGGAGSDRFAFGNGSGDDTILDFNVSDDTLYLPGSEIPLGSAADVIAAATATTQYSLSGVSIDLGGGNSLFLAGLTLGDLNSLTYAF